MFRSIFRSVCVSCGEDCDFDELICDKCSEELPAIKIRCSGCGHPLNVGGKHCKYCGGGKGIDFYYSDYYYKDVFKTVIHQIKYNWRWRGVSHIKKFCKMDGLDLPSYDVVVPVPYHFLRRLSRFVQPVDIIAEAFKEKGANVEKVLVRIKNTEYQSRLSRSKRLVNVKNVFKAVKDLTGMKVLIIDDIFTTGATVYELAKVLRFNGATQVDVYTLLAGVQR